MRYFKTCLIIRYYFIVLMFVVRLLIRISYFQPFFLARNLIISPPDSDRFSQLPSFLLTTNIFMNADGTVRTPQLSCTSSLPNAYKEVSTRFRSKISVETSY
jgi:hypothetical protein